jgi:hypothetical protein
MPETSPLDGLEWLPVSHAMGWLVRHPATPTHLVYVPDPDQWVGAIVGALSSGAPDRRLDEILEQLKRLIIMSGNTQAAVDHVHTAVASLKAEFLTDLGVVVAKFADLSKQIADLKAAGGGASDAQVADLEASATDVEATVKAMHDGLNPGPVVNPDPVPTPEPVPTPDPVVFDSSDPTPNAPGGRNSDQLPGFDPSKPVTP